VATVDPFRSEVARRGGYRCEYCGYPEAASSTPLEIDHIVPEAKGGRTTLDNLALCCRSCNLHKHAKTEALDPLTRAIVPLFHPRMLQWHEHFVLDRSTGEIHGLTSIGRASVEALVLNSHHLIMTRQLLTRLRLI
jgi:HNH endonuclease